MAGSENLTRDEAKARAVLLRSHSYEVELDLTADADTFGSVTTATFDCIEPGASTWIDLIAPEVESVELNGMLLDVAAVRQDARIALPDLQASNVVVVRARCAYMNTGEGVHRFVDPVDGETYLYTQFESADARRMYACFEQPDLKATFTLGVTAPAHWKVISNAATPEPTPVEGNRAHWAFATTARMSTYITALVAGPYFEVRDEYTGPFGTYPMGVFCRASVAEYLDADDIFLITKQGFEYFESKFGVGYPFGKYDQLFVPEFNSGAMENAGCVTFHEDLVFRSRVTDAAYEQRANTILHELAHMWFGDLVTMTWWDDLWLNESFAEWAAHWANANATRYADAWTTFSNLRKAWAYRQDQLPSTHPIAADMVDLESVRVNFDGITYAKGASALRQLVAWVGEAEFLEGVRQYFAKHAWGNTELRDLLVELEQTSGRDLSAWTEEWLRTSGVNLLRPDITPGAYMTIADFTIVQEPPTTPAGLPQVLRSHRIGIGLYSVKNGRLVRTDRLEVDVTGERTSIPALKSKMQPDLILLNDGDFTFAKIRLDDRSWKTAVKHLADLDDSLARALIWGAAWDMTRDAEVSTGEFLALVLGAVGGEGDVGVVQQVLRQVKSAIDQFAAPEHRTDYLLRLADRCLELALASTAGSDHQLAFTRAFANAATSPTQLDVVASLLGGTTVWDGLVIDTDLRWLLLARLVAHARAGAVEIDAELERDDTAAGRRQAAALRAAAPTPEAKAAAWREIMANLELPNAMLMATMGGFMQPGQAEVLAPYRERYFADLPQVWSERTMEMAQDITSFTYPIFFTDEETLKLTDDYLSREGLLAAERRLVIEARDGVARAMRAQERDLAG